MSTKDILKNNLLVSKRNQQLAIKAYRTALANTQEFERKTKNSRQMIHAQELDHLWAKANRLGNEVEHYEKVVAQIEQRIKESEMAAND